MTHRNTTPILLLGYNRPEQSRGLIQSLRMVKPSNILFAVDGPRVGKAGDEERVRATQLVVNEIDWPATVETRFRRTNLGLRHAVVDAVNWALSENGTVIVFEDDFRPGPQTISFLQYQLTKHSRDEQVAHINGYNVVPTAELSNPHHQTRWTRYIESYAWATWDRAWHNYDDNLVWAQNASVTELKNIVGTLSGAIRWMINFNDAASNRIDTWAYRWLSSIWSRRGLVVAPNRNLGLYTGHTGGTHTRTRGYAHELNPEPLLHLQEMIDYDRTAEEFVSEKIFGEQLRGVITGAARSLALRVIN